MIGNRNGLGTCSGIIADIGLDCRKWPIPVKRKIQVVAIRPRETSATSKGARPKNGSEKAMIKMMFRITFNLTQIMVYECSLRAIQIKALVVSFILGEVSL
jgi:hypothetical protein